MRKLCLIPFLAACCICFAEQAGPLQSKITTDIVEVSLELQHAWVRPLSSSALAVKFNTAGTWHFYADADTAPGGKKLQITARLPGAEFSEPILPSSHDYFDKGLNQKIRVYSGSFTVYLPFKTAENITDGNIEVQISGAVCSDQLCRIEEYSLGIPLTISQQADMNSPAFRLPAKQPTKKTPAAATANGLTVQIALPLAIIAGLLLNVMPCVWPVLPIVVMRLVGQARQSRVKSMLYGAGFWIGIVLFFAALAILNIALRIGFGSVYNWGDQFRNPEFIIAMTALMVVLAMFMFGVFNIAIPASISGQNGDKKGLLGIVAMGFLAALLSTPCSFGILIAVFAWAQTQALWLATLTLLLIGAGMGLPYFLLTMIPGLLKKTPKPGRWMEIFKITTGFILLFIAAKLFDSVPQSRAVPTLYFMIILAFAVWIWGGWVDYNTSKLRKYIIRIIAIVIILVSGRYLLAEPKQSKIDWQDYNAAVIAQAREQNRPVLIKFTADWCTNCTVLDLTVYKKDGIADLIKGKHVLAVRADTTERDFQATKDMNNIYGQSSLPVTILLLPGKEDFIVLPGIAIEQKLVENLNSIK